jgi:glutaryl-CoA dehydrogenase/cyclohexanecarboxylate-CoA ligase
MKDWRPYLTQLTEEKMKAFTEKGYWPNKRLCEYLDEEAALYPDKIAIVDRHGRYTYKQFADWVNAAARAFLVRGVEPGDVISFQLPSLEKVFIAGPDVPKDLPQDMEPFEQFLQYSLGETGELNVFEEIEVDPNSVTQIAFTSGTTGEPKGILHTHNTLLDTCQSWIERFSFTSDDVFHMASTLGHQTGFLYGTEMPIIAKGTIVLQDVWDAAEFVRLVEREHITASNGAIPFLKDFLQAPNFREHDLSSLRFFGCFGAGLPRPLARLAYEKLSNLTLIGGWGMTETALPVTNLPTDSIDKVCDTDGVPVRGSEIKIMNEAFTADLPPGVEGEIVTRGPMRHLGFLQMALSKELFLEGDWYKTGDRGYIREDGYLVMTARSKDIIVRGGENIPVMEVENLLMEHPKVGAAAVVAVPDERLGEKACACIIPQPGQTFTFEEMVQWLADKKLTKQFWPEMMEIFSEFPTTPSGKVQKFNLRAMVHKKIS